jgi:hypothetical protein
MLPRAWQRAGRLQCEVCFWVVAQRFTAAMTAPLEPRLLAAEVKAPIGNRFSAAS